MGFLKKKGEDSDESSRLALFGSRSKNKNATAAPASNPYAQPAIPPDPYTKAKMNAGILPPPQQGPPPGSAPGGYQNSPQPGNGYGRGAPSSYNPTEPNGYPQDNKQAGPPPGPGGYGPNKFGNEKGYGASGGNPYAGVSQPTRGGSGGGGYGGLGRTNSSETTNTDANRDALFGGARERIDQRQPNGPPGYEYNGGNDPSQERSYGAYGDRQLTAEEEEEEDIQATKQEIKFVKQQDVSSTRNALRMAAMAEETGRNTLARLGAQGERIHNTDRNLDIGHNAINIAEDKSKELKTLNRSMFAVHASNPFTAKERRIRNEEKIIERHQLEREQREATREAAFKSNQRMNQNFKAVESKPGAPNGGRNLAERSKYQFEADSDDDRMEDEIERNVDEMSGAVGRLNVLARAMGDEADAQNAQLLKVQDKSDRLDDRFHLQTERLRRIR